MFCNFCSKISFQRLSECRFSFRPDVDPAIVQEYAKKLFYFHHRRIACVNKASLEEGCRLCALFITFLTGNINISRDDKLGAALDLPGAGVWVVLTQDAGTPATTTDGRRFAARMQASNWTNTPTLHYNKIAAQIDVESMLAGFDKDILVNCPLSVLKDTPLEDDKAWLENSMKMAKGWYKNCLESGYHGACALSSTKTVRLPARVIDVGPMSNQSPSTVSSSDALSELDVHPEIHTAFQVPEGSDSLNRLMVGLPTPNKVWEEHPIASSASLEPLAAKLSKLSQKYCQEKALIKFPRILETNGTQGMYLAFSYCWGETQKAKLLTANLEAYKRHLPVNKLSRTIRDAVSVTRALGFRYLWVDALCIIQDSDLDKKSQLPLMGSIYQDSAITLAAAVGDHADAGLFAIRNPHAWRSRPLYKEKLPNGRSCQIYAQLPRNNLYDTPLDTRAWTFQEEILARRTLKFTPKCLRWSCASFCMAEATPGIGVHPRARPHHNLREWLSQPDWKPNWAEALDPRRRYFEDWYEAVANFTQRGIKFSSDRLRAIGCQRWQGWRQGWGS